jgi:hypothetical protein
MVVSLGDLLLGSLHGAGVHVLGRDPGVRAELDADDPRVCQDILDEDAVVRVRLEYAPKDGPARAGREVLDGRRVRCRLLLFLLLLLHALRERLGGRGGQRHVRDRVLRARTLGRVRRVEAIRGLGDAPRELLEVQTVIDDAARPDVDQTGVVGS